MQDARMNHQLFIHNHAGEMILRRLRVGSGCPRVLHFSLGHVEQVAPCCTSCPDLEGASVTLVGYEDRSTGFPCGR